ncbi:hypothetical protein DM01DRAFT_1284211 [Hesseltinella vesiculosa]|uniref:VTT domain-containing protein n=1 Tax=Hesseltinella vesiculosa TaxID=101127 RepID=A0A1X2GN87_9FUNG|nr:hypothetical protein DM01DRAFT_1284211 [Hesseltinella vesiculosa]
MGDNQAELKPPVKSLGAHVYRQILPRLVCFVACGLAMFYMIMTFAHDSLAIDLPRSLQDLQELTTQLDVLRRAGWEKSLGLTFVFVSLYLWQQMFSMPGTVLLNLLAGHLYGVFVGTVWTAFLCALGSTIAYWVGLLVGEPLMQLAWFQQRIRTLQDQMERDRGLGLFWWLLFARLFPFSPYWLINLGSPFLNVPVQAFFWSTFYGVIPYNLVCTQAGQVLGELTSTADLLAPALMLKLCLVSFLTLIPIAWGKTLQNRLRSYLERQ